MDVQPDAVLSAAAGQPPRPRQIRAVHRARPSGWDADRGARRDAWGDAFPSPSPGPAPELLAAGAGKSVYLVPAFRRARAHLEPAWQTVAPSTLGAVRFAARSIGEAPHENRGHRVDLDAPAVQPDRLGRV